MAKPAKIEQQPALFATPQAEVIPPTGAAKPRKTAVAVVKSSGTNVSAGASEASSDDDKMLAMIERATRDPSVDVPKMQALMAMWKEFKAERAEKIFNERMADTQAEIGVVVVDKSNPQTRSKYASYPALDRAVRPIYSKHKFALSFDTEEGAPADHVRVVCFVSCSGHTRKHHIDMPCDGKGAKGGDVMTKTHATGSGVSYGMRYLLKMVFNIATGEDDDGNKSGNKPKEKEISQDPVSAKQVEALIEAIEFCGVSTKNFCTHFGIDKVEELPASVYNDALTACKNYKEKSSGKGSSEGKAATGRA